MKRSVCALLAALALLVSLPVAYAHSGGDSYLFDLSCDGSHTRQAVTGDIITLTLTLRRTDSREEAPMYAMQDELCYDPTFFQLVEGSAMTAPSVQTAELSLRDGWRSFYMNFVSLSGGEVWPAETTVGTVQLRIIGQSGASTITQRGYLVSDHDGAALSAQAEDLTVVISDSCTVRFDSGGGSPVEEQIVRLGGRVSRPRDPVRPGYTLEGWYTDSGFSRQWNFKRDVVEGNMTLYARWSEGSAASGGGWWLWALGGVAAAGLLAMALLLGGRCTVRFDTGGGSPLPPCRAVRGRPLPYPPVPTRPASSFAGWYRDAACTDPWDFELDPVEHSMTLYARWR